jgi:hypothetical protein
MIRPVIGGWEMGEAKDTSKQAAKDAMEDLDLKDEDAEKVGGGDLSKFTAAGKHIPEVTITL